MSALSVAGALVSQPYGFTVSNHYYPFSTTTASAYIQEVAEEYGVDASQLEKTIKCESQFKPDAWNKEDHLGGAKGIAQFLQPTFDRYSKQMGFEEADVWNPYDAMRVMAYMFSIGEERQWTCFRKLYG